MGEITNSNVQKLIHKTLKVTGWPSHAFSVYEGVWVDGISPGILKRYPKKRDKSGCYIPEAFNCFHINGNPSKTLQYGIYRSAEQPNLNIAEKYAITNPAERKRRDLWIMPEDIKQQEEFLEELKQQVLDCFLNRYQEYTDIGKLKQLILEEPRQVNNDMEHFNHGT